MHRSTKNNIQKIDAQNTIFYTIIIKIDSETTLFDTLKNDAQIMSEKMQEHFRSGNQLFYCERKTTDVKLRRRKNRQSNPTRAIYVKEKKDLLLNFQRCNLLLVGQQF